MYLNVKLFLHIHGFCVRCTGSMGREGESGGMREGPIGLFALISDFRVEKQQQSLTDKSNLNGKERY